MIDLHTHTLFSDGVLVPAELVRRAEVAGVRAIGLTDHVDWSNYDFVAERLSRFCEKMQGYPVRIVPGVEITHAPPADIGALVTKCREAGAKIVLVHGETVVEPVAPGTNLAAITACVDILAHPGLITEKEGELAEKNGVALEISGRGGHSFTNGHVLSVARKTGARMIFNTDSHHPRDLMNSEMAVKVMRGAGMTEEETEKAFETALSLTDRLLRHG